MSDSLTKKDILRALSDTWCKLAPSKIEGVGVFAIRDIPIDTHPFSTHGEDWMEVDANDVKELSPEVRALIDTYCIFVDGIYSVPSYGFKLWDTVDFLNDSKDANVISINGGEDFVTIKAIAKGEELLIDYDTITQEVPD